MKISETGLNLIKSFEGCRLTAYRCPAGVWTIGWGHTGGVYAGQTITQAEADALLTSDLAKYEAKVDKYNDTYGWNQNEFDALVSFAYNIGSIDQLTANGTRSRDVIAAKMLEYNKAGGKVLAGLAKRRAAEQGLFLTPIQAKTKAGWNKGQYGYWWQDEDGSWPANEWRLINHHYYLFNRDGYMVTGWHRWDGQTCDPDDGSGDWYFLDNTSGGELEGACWHGRENGSLEIWYVD